jgi:hypothetical protein
MRKSLLFASLIALTVAIAPACATKGFVRTEVGAVNSKVDTVSGTDEQTQQRDGGGGQGGRRRTHGRNHRAERRGCGGGASQRRRRTCGPGRR